MKETTLQALVVDDESQVRKFIADVLATENWSVGEAENAEQAFEMLSRQDWLLVLCDVVLGGGVDGYEVLRRFSEKQMSGRFVLMTGHGSAVGALDATASGAYDYLVKPFSVEDILNIAETVRERHRVERRTETSGESGDAAAGAGSANLSYTSADIPLVGKSPKFVECLKMVGRVSVTNLPVLIVGESGTGKEVVARAVHRRSSRAGRPFVAVNCGAIPVELIESELFGHAKGSFTGAERERRGLWEEAEGGTIFLDEITETNPLFQVKLLRALQEGEIRRVGSNQTMKMDVRVIAASNRDIAEEVRLGRFRQDLMYRLNAVTIQLPPLRERVEDIPLLAEHFSAPVRPKNAQPVRFSVEAMELLKNYRWEGNVRELENAVLHAAMLCDHLVYPEHLPAYIRRSSENGSAPSGGVAAATQNLPGAESQSTSQWLPLSQMEAEYVSQVLAHTGGNKQAASRILGIDRKTLGRILSRNKAEA